MNIKQISVKMSWLLRHCQTPQYIDPDGGWADVKAILSALKESFPEVTPEIIRQIVAADKKGRYSFDITGTRIRANQGHSIPGIAVEMESPKLPEYLYHGTASCFLKDILRDGLKPMSRQFVHISPDYATAVKVGSRHGKPAVLMIRAREFVADGFELFRSPNGVWQAKAVPPEYLTVCNPD